METFSSNDGLCSNCIHAPGCTYPRDTGQPILQCEEYDCAPAPVAGANRVGKPFKARSQRRATSQSGDQVPGLCSNCENRHACTFPKPEGGVWRCEEYQ